MKMSNRRKKLIATAIAVMCLAVVALSGPGRAALSKVWSSLTSGDPVATTVQAGGDIEQRARLRHGWNAGVVNSVVRGTMTRYDREGNKTSEAGITLYRRYPDRVRIELEQGGQTIVMGFDDTQAWRSGRASLSEEEARDIRAFLRVWPERLFVGRARGASYREVGRRFEQFKPESPWQDAVKLSPPVEMEQAEMEDRIGAVPAPGQVGDRRRVMYYVEKTNHTIQSVRWLEPDDPRREVSGGRGPMTDVRIEFGDWRMVEGVLWPFEVVRWSGGRVEYRIVLSEVKMNQTLGDTIFQNTNR